MRTKKFGPEEKPWVEFSYDKTDLWLRSMFGVICSNNGMPYGISKMKGLMLLRVDGLRYEAEKLPLVKKKFSASKFEAEFKTNDDKMAIKTCWTFDKQTGVISRKDSLTNTTKKAVTLQRYLARYTLTLGRYEAYIQESRWLKENQCHWVPLLTGDHVLKTEWGRSSEGGTPYACVRECGATEGIAFHIVPHGNWMIKLSCKACSSSLPFTIVELGLSDEDLNFVIKPGETVEMPEILCQGLPEGDPVQAAPALQQYILNRLPSDIKPCMPILYNPWMNNYADLVVENLRKQLAVAKELGFEVFHVDAGWFGEGEGWANRGDWREKKDMAFFGKMSDFADEVRAAGLGFGLWMEPETFVDGVPIRLKKPEWFTGPRINLQIKAAYKYLLSEISRLIDKYKLAYMKMDMNQDLGYDESGSELHLYITHWNKLIDELRRKYPKVFFENCSSGGMRIDLNTTNRFDGQFVTDTLNPVEMLKINQSTALRMPLGRLIHWVVAEPFKEFIPNWGDFRDHYILTPQGPVWNTAERMSLDFVLAVGVLGQFGMSADLTGFSAKSKARIKWFINFSKKHRKSIANSITHLLTPIESIEKRLDWAAFQMQNRDKNIIFAYHRADDGQSDKHFKLKNLNPSAKYEVRKVAFETELEKTYVTTGKMLMNRGLECTIVSSSIGINDSAIFLVNRK